MNQGRVAALLTAVALSGCGKVSDGPRSQLRLQTDPPAAQAMVNAQTIQTPGNLDLDSGRDQEIRIAKSGYKEVLLRIGSGPSRSASPSSPALSSASARRTLGSGTAAGWFIGSSEAADGGPGSRSLLVRLEPGEGQETIEAASP